MSDSISIDTSELRALAADLSAAGPLVSREVRGVIVKGAVTIKNQLRSEAQASRHFRGMASSIGFDVTGGATAGDTAIEAQIGPSSEAGSPGNLANIAYFGTSRGGGTVPDPLLALETEAPNVEKYLAELAERAVRGA